MCGIAGYVGPLAREHAGQAVIRRMTDTLAHRGPDDAGVWVDVDSGVALGNRRLAVLDLSAEGHQPMSCACGRHVITYNGEVYNVPEIAVDLERTGISFRGHSDTELIVEAICAWGVRAVLERLNGMFAFAHWDRVTRRLDLARDRMGIKPLYYALHGDTLLFGSEIKALRAHPAFRGEIDRGALALYFQLDYIPAPHSIYKDVRKLPPATFVTVSADGSPGVSPPAGYWSLAQVAERGLRDPLDATPAEAADRLEELLRDAVRRQMVADVPVGAFLSGGVDSASVAALMQAESSIPIRTFSIGFHDTDYDEAPYARRIAAHLGTDHNEFYVSPREFMDVIPKLPFLCDEPFAEPSQIPMYVLAEIARRQVTVVLTGDGGDELFCGYGWYPKIAQAWRLNRAIPRPLRAAAAAGLEGVLGRGLHGNRRSRKLQECLSAERPEDVYLSLRTSAWPRPESPVRGAARFPSFLPDLGRNSFADIRRRAMLLDTAVFLADHPLAKTDRATMAVGLEARVPLIDHRVVEFAWRLPMEMLVREGVLRWIQRQVLYRHVPRDLIDRPKVGFVVPMGEWMRGPLRNWAEELLDAGRLKREGFLDADRVRTAWREYLTGQVHWQRPLWGVLVFQQWLENQEGLSFRHEDPRISGAPAVP